MNYDIRQICNYMPEIHSRYYIDTNGVVYTSMSENTKRIMVDGIRININKLKKQLMTKLDTTNNQIINLTGFPKYFLKNDGKILQRLATRCDESGVVDVCLITLNNRTKGVRYKIHRLMAYVFIGNPGGKEIHHIDGNRANNKLDNLKLLTFEEHRGKNNFLNNHNYLKCND